MAREVNLSSREWCDLVFDGKNKDFGAYIIRTESAKRHNLAVLWALIGTVAVAEPEVLEDVLSSVKVTELQIVDDDKVRPEDEILTQEEIEETNKAFGQTNVDNGQDERDKFQTAVTDVVVEKPVEKPKEAVAQVFHSVEQMPQFPGGEAALMKFLQSHINYPPMAAENNVQGRVVVQFVVDKTGKVGEVKVVRNVDKDLDKEAVRVCKSLPKFTPGRQNGQAVAVWYTLPVTFKLQGTN